MKTEKSLKEMTFAEMDVLGEAKNLRSPRFS